MSARLVTRDGPAAIWELIGSGDAGRVNAMLELYAGLFPQYAHYVPRMKRRAEFGEEHRPGHIVHYWLVEVDGKPAGIRTFRYVRHRHCGLAHALAIDPSYREVMIEGQRLSRFLIYACLDQVIRDAKRFGDKPVLGMVNEVESVRLMKRYKEYGILELPVHYKEAIFPPERAGQTRADEIALARFSPMFLGLLPNPESGVLFYTGELIADFAMAFLVDHYGLPMDHPQVQAVLNSIPVLIRRTEWILR
jgi:hypothetical protein